MRSSVTPARVPSADPREDAAEAFNKLSEVLDFLQVLGMALANEEGASPYVELATVTGAAQGLARTGYEAAGRLCRFYDERAKS